MGHWEQIGEDNLRWRERRQRLPRWRRIDWMIIPAVLVTAATWALSGAGLWRWLSGSAG